MASYQDLLNTDLDDIISMNKKELSSTISKLSKVANARLKRLEESGLSETSPIYQSVQKGGKLGQGKFSASGKTRNQLLQEFKRLRVFLEAESSTIKGVRKINTDIENRLGVKLSNAELKQFWKYHDEIKSKGVGLYRIVGSERVQKLVAEKMNNDGNIMSEIAKGLEDIYIRENRADSFYEVAKKAGRLLK